MSRDLRKPTDAPTYTTPALFNELEDEFKEETRTKHISTSLSHRPATLIGRRQLTVPSCRLRAVQNTGGFPPAKAGPRRGSPHRIRDLETTTSQTARRLRRVYSAS